MRAVLLVPLVGTLVAVGVPLTRYVERQRHEQTAIEIVQEVRGAQRTFKQSTGGYATRVEALTAGCGSGPAPLPMAALERLAGAGYGVLVRAAAGAQSAQTTACGGEVMASDYYVAVAPLDAGAAGQQAFAARADGETHLFYDGLPPSEASMASGLATPLSQRATFRIP